GSSASKAGRCAGNFAGRLAASKASDPLRSAPKVASEADLTAVHAVDLTGAREALPFAEVHEVPPSVAGDQPGRRDVAVVAALARKRKTKQTRPNSTTYYKTALSYS